MKFNPYTVGYTYFDEIAPASKLERVKQLLLKERELQKREQEEMEAYDRYDQDESQEEAASSSDRGDWCGGLL